MPRGKIGRPTELFIDGDWIEGSGKVEVINPATEEVLGLTSEGSAKQAEEAVLAARKAFDEGSWSRLTGCERGELLNRLADLFETHKDEIIEVLISEIGAVRAQAEMLHFNMPLGQLRWWAEQAEQFEYRELMRLADQRGEGRIGTPEVRKEPVGVVSAITPFNFPWSLGIWKLGPALAMGNTMVLKPSPYTPTSSLIHAQLLAEAGLPAGVFNVVTGGADVGETLTTHPGVDMVTFTGSDTIGRQVGAQATGHLKKVVLELGGKSPNIVFEGSKLDPIVSHQIFQFTAQAGQGCSLNTRLLVQRSIHDEMVERVCGALAHFKVGDPNDPTSMMGPLIREVQRQRVERYVREGLEAGAKVAFGGGRPPGLDRGYYVEPTVLTGVKNDMAVAQDEIFGPVLCVIPFDDKEDAIRIANASRYGLAASVWHPDPTEAYSVAARLRAGSIGVNGGGGGSPESPYGGWKDSGIGVENGKYGLHEYVRLKALSYPAGGA